MATIIRVSGSTEPLTDLSLESLQAAVGGGIEHVTLPDGRDMFIDDEGKLKGKPVNWIATALWHGERDLFDVIVGDAVVCEKGEVE